VGQVTLHGADGNGRSRLSRAWLAPGARQTEQWGPPLMPALDRLDATDPAEPPRVVNRGRVSRHSIRFNRKR